MELRNLVIVTESLPYYPEDTDETTCGKSVYCLDEFGQFTDQQEPVSWLHHYFPRTLCLHEDRLFCSGRDSFFSNGTWKVDGVVLDVLAKETVWRATDSSKNGLVGTLCSHDRRLLGIQGDKVLDILDDKVIAEIPIDTPYNVRGRKSLVLIDNILLETHNGSLFCGYTKAPAVSEKPALFRVYNMSQGTLAFEGEARLNDMCSFSNELLLGLEKEVFSVEKNKNFQDLLIRSSDDEIKSLFVYQGILFAFVLHSACVLSTRSQYMFENFGRLIQFPEIYIETYMPCPIIEKVIAVPDKVYQSVKSMTQD